MFIPVTWQKLLSYRDKPLEFVAGIRNVVRKGYYCPFHEHAAVEIVYHPAGRGVTQMGKKPIAFQELGAVIYAPGERHDQRMEESGEDWCVQIAIPASLRVGQGISIPHVADLWIREEIERLCQPEAATDAYIVNLRATAVLLGLLRSAQLQTDEEALPLTMRRAAAAERYIAQHFASIESVEEIAVHLRISPDHLRHSYRLARGKSLVRQLNEVRIARAKLLLATAPFSLKQIASMCGFKDEYYFSAVFKKMTGTAPGRHRRR